MPDAWQLHLFFKKMRYLNILFCLMWGQQLAAQHIDVFLSSTDCLLCNKHIVQVQSIPIPVKVYFNDSSLLDQIPKGENITSVYSDDVTSLKSHYAMFLSDSLPVIEGLLPDLKKDLSKYKTLYKLGMLKFSSAGVEAFRVDNATVYFKTTDERVIYLGNESGRSTLLPLTIPDLRIKELYEIAFYKDCCNSKYSTAQEYFERAENKSSKQFYYTNCQVKETHVYGFLVLKVPVTYNFGPKYGVGTRVTKEFFIHKRDLETGEDEFVLIDEGKGIKGYDIDEYNDFYIDGDELVLAVFSDNDGEKDRVLARFLKGTASKYQKPKLLKNRISRFNKETKLYYDLGDVIFSNGYMSFKTSPEFSPLNRSKTVELNVFKNQNRIVNLDRSEFDFKASIRDFIVVEEAAYFLVQDGIELNYFKYDFEAGSCVLQKSFINSEKLGGWKLYDPQLAYTFNPGSGRVEFVNLTK